MDERLLTAHEVAALLQVPEATLAQWRYLKRGPTYLKIGKHVRYRPSDIEEWINQHQHQGDI